MRSNSSRGEALRAEGFPAARQSGSSIAGKLNLAGGWELWRQLAAGRWPAGFNDCPGWGLTGLILSRARHHVLCIPARAAPDLAERLRLRAHHRLGFEFRFAR